MHNYESPPAFPFQATFVFWDKSLFNLPPKSNIIPTGTRKKGT